MQTDRQAKDLDGVACNVRIDKFPDACPACHSAIYPNFVDMRVAVDKRTAQVAFQCTRHLCQALFISTYSLNAQVGGRHEYRYVFSAPVTPTHHTFPDVIQKVSPTFCLVFGQVEHAESEQLDQLVGIGLRKALEFLVKDFAQSEHPESTEAIQKSLLGPCIDKYLDDQNIKSCAKRAVWLANDETHYMRKWQNKDIQDLKLLVRLTINWLENYLLTKQYIADMSQKA
jgi:hypothetical protein